jgi:hypothetical protein
VHIFLSTNDGSGHSDFKPILCSEIDVTTRHQLASSKEKQMGQFPKKDGASHASEPLESRNPPRTGFVVHRRQAAGRRGLDQEQVKI